jgi:hypothetical protein
LSELCSFLVFNRSYGFARPTVKVTIECLKFLVDLSASSTVGKSCTCFPFWNGYRPAQTPFNEFMQFLKR